MGSVNVYHMPVISPLMFPASGQATQNLSDSTSAVAVIFKASKSASITKIGAWQTAKTGTAPTYRFALEGVTDTRVPDGTVKGSTTAKKDQANPANGWTWYTLDTPFTTTQGQLYAATVRYLSGTVNGSNFATYAYCVVTERGGTPYSLSCATGTWTLSTRNLPSISIQYSDGSFEPYMGSLSSATITQWNSSSNPLQRGNAMTFTYGCTLSGVLCSIRIADASDFKINVYAGSNTTPIASITVDASQYAVGTGNAVAGLYLFDSPITVTPGTVYRFTIEPTTGTNIVTFWDIGFNESDGRIACFGPMYKTTSPSSISWSDSTSNAFCITPTLATIDNGESLLSYGS